MSNAVVVGLANAVITGIVVLALSMWTLATDKDYSAAWRSRTAQ